jgi:hypothetical protein
MGGSMGGIGSPGGIPSPGGSIGGSMGGSGIPLAGSGAGMAMPTKEDTALAADLGLGGSMGGVPSPGRTGPGGSVAGGSLGGSVGGSRSGINVFSGDDLGGGFADPSAATNISAGVPDQINLDSVGSGSGLLDLTRESDDTSLGAELLDEISPGAGTGTRAGTGVAAADTGVVEEGPVITQGAPTRRGLGTPVYVEAADPSAPAFGWAALGAALFVLFAAVFLMAGVLGVRIDALKWAEAWGTLKLLGVGAGVTILFAIIGAVVKA